MIQRSTHVRGGDDAGELHKTIRRLGLLRRRYVMHFNPRLELSRAMDLSELEEAYRLVHAVYVKNGYLRPRDCGLRVRLFEASPEMATFVARAEGQIQGVISVIPDTAEFGLPSDVGFHREIHGLRFEGRHVCEITNLAISPDCADPSVFFRLLQVVYAQGMSLGCDDAFIAVSPSHASFFHDVMQFSAMAGPRSYSKDYEDIVVGMRANLRTVESQLIEMDGHLGESAFLHDFLVTNNPFFSKLFRWRMQAKHRFLKPSLLRELFIRRGELLECCGPRHLDALRSQWGSHVFDEVIVGTSPVAEEMVGRTPEAMVTATA